MRGKTKKAPYSIFSNFSAFLAATGYPKDCPGQYKAALKFEVIIKTFQEPVCIQDSDDTTRKTYSGYQTSQIS